MSTEAWWAVPLTVLCMLGTVVVLVFILSLVRRTRSKDAAAEAARMGAIEGRSNETSPSRPEPFSPFTSGRCIVCGEAADKPWPDVKSTLGTDLWGHRRLNNSTPMYLVEDRGENKTCRACYRMVTGWWEEAFAQIRADTAAFNGKQQERVTVLAMGGMLTRAQVEVKKYESAIDMIRSAEFSTKQLPAAATVGVTLAPAAPRKEGD